MKALKDDASQIRIRKFVEDGRVAYEVSLGYWIHRGVRRVWFHEGHAKGAGVTFHETLDEAKTAATSPKLVARRDYFRTIRKDAPVSVPYTVS